MASGSGFLSGYGDIARSAYATPLELGYKTWTLDFSPVSGGVAFPTDARLNPYKDPAKPLMWQTEDWDPALRFWTLAFDSQLVEWLQDLDIAAPSVLAAREFASQHAQWQMEVGVVNDAVLPNSGLLGAGWLLPAHLAWRPADNTAASAAAAWIFINSELEELIDLMEDDRGRYLAESAEQADAIPAFFAHLLAMDSASKPHTMQLIRCGLAIGNLVYMHYKQMFRRIRASTLCPGLVPPFGPPRHPAFPSGHSFLGHFIALLLLEIDVLAERCGLGLQADGATVGHRPTWAEYQAATLTAADLDGPLFWLAARLAKNRERIGVHYRSDSLASRRLAGGIWSCLFDQAGAATHIEVPTLKRVLARARAEWA
ncbi:MAG TPA: hypothetical protein PKB14_11390 [Rubrivivax sp.]|nr:hypothetical protein [Rubrivivax sp.]